MTTGTCFLKDGRFWFYHSEKLDDLEEEKSNPGDKLWLVVKHMADDKQAEIEPGHGYKLTIGQTVKFGRVRYKVIEVNSK